MAQEERLRRSISLTKVRRGTESSEKSVEPARTAGSIGSQNLLRRWRVESVHRQANVSHVAKVEGARKGGGEGPTNQVVRILTLVG